MAEENWCASDIPDPVDLQEPHQDSGTSVEQQCFNGDQETSVCNETEEQMNQVLGTDQVNLCPDEQAEEWEQIVWPVHPITSTSPQLSFATVQWDLADAAVETPPLVTDSGSANGPDRTEDDGSVTSFGTASPSPCQSEEGSAELFKREDGEEQEGFDSLLPESALQCTDHYSEPCDAAEVQEPKRQEKEDSRQELLGGDNGLPLSTDSEEEEERSETSGPLQTEHLIHTVGEIQSSEDEEDSFVYLKLEEEQEEPCVLLTGQRDPEEELISTSSIEIKEEKDELEEELRETYESCSEENEESEGTATDKCVNDLDVPVDSLQTGDPEPTLDSDLLQSEILGENSSSGSEEDPTVHTDRLEMREEVDQNVVPQQSEAVDNSEEASVQEEGDEEKLENSQQVLQETENLQEASFLKQQDCELMTLQDREDSQQTQHSKEDRTEKPEQISDEAPQQTDDSDHLGESQQLEQSAEMEPTDQLTQPENAEQSVESTQKKETVCHEAGESGEAEQQEQTEPPEQPPLLPEQLEQPEKTNESEVMEQLSHEAEVTQQTELADSNQVHKQAGTTDRAAENEAGEDGHIQTVVANGELPQHPEPHMNGGEVDRGMAHRLAERLFNLEGIQRADVVKHIDKDNDFSRAVGEEYLSFFDFSGQNLDHALRSFLKVVILIGETQERERVLQHFSCRFHQCNPDSFSSSGAVLALTCALMLLNTDLHGQHVGKSMSSSKFVSNLDEMNEGGNFNKDLLKSLYSSIKTEPLQWAVDEEELKNSMLLDEDAGEDAPLRSKANPFQDVPHDKKAAVIKQGFLQRKLHADVDGKRTPWGKRGWKTFYGVLKGMVLYLQKDDYQREQQTNEEVVSVHHSLAEPATDYTKKPHVFRLQTADWRIFLFQASSKVEMNSWISRINLVSALHSSPPFPAAVGSQRRFCRPILPASQSAHTLERQLQSHAGMLESFKADLSYQQQNPPEGRKAKAKDLEDHRVRAEYLHHEMCRYEIYIQALEAWQSVKKTGDGVLSSADLNLFDKAVSVDSVGEEEDEEVDGGVLKKSHSSPSLELEMAPPQVVKVKRNISERRTYRRVIVPRWNKES